MFCMSCMLLDAQPFEAEPNYFMSISNSAGVILPLGSMHRIGIFISGRDGA